MSVVHLTQRFPLTFIEGETQNLFKSYLCPVSKKEESLLLTNLQQYFSKCVGPQKSVLDMFSQMYLHLHITSYFIFTS